MKGSGGLTPSVTVNYPSHATLRDGATQLLRVPKNRRQIAAELRLHTNTVSSIIRGTRAENANVHRVFTVLNVGVDNELHRADFVLCFDGTNDVRDETFEECLVFPRLGAYLALLGPQLPGAPDATHEKKLGDLAHVRTIYVTHMLQGLPVAANLVQAVYGVIRQRLTERTLAEDGEGELFN